MVVILQNNRCLKINEPLYIFLASCCFSFTAARIVLFIQNFMVALCAIAVCLLLKYESEITGHWNGAASKLCYAAIIILGVIAEMASVGYKIAIEKDWFVVVAQGNKSLLASEFDNVTTILSYLQNN